MEKEKIFSGNEKKIFEAEDEMEIVDIFTFYTGINNNFLKTVDSILNQSLKNWKWNILDCSENVSLLKSEEFEEFKKDNRIEIISKEMFTQRFLKNADIYSEYIAFVDEKNTLDPTFLECSLSCLKNNNSFGWVYSNYITNYIEEVIYNNELNYSDIRISYLLKKDVFINNNEYFLKSDIIEYNKFFLVLLKEKIYPIKMNYYGFSTYDNKILEESTYEIEKYEIEKNEYKYPASCEYYYTSPKIMDYNKRLINKKNNKINILFIFPWFKMGGADKFNLQLISNLDKEKYEITIITTEDCNNEWRDKFEEHATVFDLTTFLNRENWAGFIYYIIETRNIDISMISNSYYAYYAIPWIKSKFPNLIVIDYLHAVNPDWRNGEYPADSTSICRILDMTYVSSEYIQKFMKEEKGRKKENVKIAYIGVNNEYFSENLIDIKEYPNIFEILDRIKDKKVILFCSRISNEKRPIFMLEILNKILYHEKNIMLLVVGDGEMLSQMKKFVVDNNLEENVIFFGKQNDVRPFYKIADSLVICSEREGITLTTYEAMSMGLPVVSADVGGQYELVNDKCGRLVKLENNDDELEKYIEAIKYVLFNDNYIEMKKQCVKVIKEKFSIQKIVDFFDSEFERLLKHGTKVPLELSDNEEMYSQYLVMYNELDRRYYNVTNNNIDFEELIREKDKLIKKQEIEKQDYYNEIIKVYNSRTWKLANSISKIIKKFKN